MKLILTLTLCISLAVHYSYSMLPEAIIDQGKHVATSKELMKPEAKVEAAQAQVLDLPNSLHQLALEESENDEKGTKAALAKITRLILEGRPVDEVSDSGKTPLFFAVIGRKKKTIELLIGLGADRTKIDLTLNTTLMQRARQEIGDLFARAEKYETEKITAMKKSLEKKIERMKERQLTQQKQNITCLSDAIDLYDIEVIESALQKFKPNAASLWLLMNKIGEQTRGKESDEQKKAFAIGADLLFKFLQNDPHLNDPKLAFTHSKDAVGRTPMHEAVSFNSEHLLRQMIAYGFDLHGKDVRDRTPLDLAEEFDFTESVKILREHNAPTGKGIPAIQTIIDTVQRPVPIRYVAAPAIAVRRPQPPIEQPDIIEY